MNEPLALLLCERGVITSQLAQRLEAVRYRYASTRAADLVGSAESQQAMIVIADVEGLPMPVINALGQLRANPATAHIPVIAFAKEAGDSLQADLVAKGATLVANEAAVLSHLSQLLDRALEIS